MGNFLNELRIVAQENQSKLNSNSLLNISLAKLREYHGSFKSVCDSFSIDLTEFDQIFNTSEDIFQLYDTDQNGLIDSLELFTGLILFSDSKFEEKIRFLFELFDFNEINSLSLQNLTFILSIAGTVTFKTYMVQKQISDDEIETFLNNYFTDDSRINISQLLKWCMNVKQVYDYFSIIKRDLPIQKKQGGLGISKKFGGLTSFQQQQSDKKKLQSQFEYQSLENIIQTKKYKQQVEWISQLTKKCLPPDKNLKVSSNLFQSKFLLNFYKEHNKDISIKVNWVFGYRCHDVKNFIEYLKPVNPNKISTEKIIYFTSNIAIVFYPKLLEQKHYLGHEQEILSLAVAKDSSMVATGELGKTPAIHIWDAISLQNIAILQGIHINGIFLMQFFHNNFFLVTVGLRQNSPILIYNTQNFNVILSTFIIGNAKEIFNIQNYLKSSFQENQIQRPNLDIRKKENNKQQALYFGQYNHLNSFLLCTKQEILIFYFSQGHFITNEINILDFNIQSSIKAGCAMRINKQNPQLKHENSSETIIIITGHKDGKVIIWEDYQFSRQMTDYNAQILKIASNEDYILIATDSAQIHFWDLACQNNYKTIDLTNFSFKLFNFYICSLLIANDKIFVSTSQGDVIEIIFSQKKDWNSESNIHNFQAQRVNYITKLSGSLKALRILERSDEDRNLIACGEQSHVYVFSLETHEIVDVWEVSDPISAFDCYGIEDGGTVYAIGCSTGKIIIRIDWEEQTYKFNAQKEILDIKFSSNGIYLIAVCQAPGNQELQGIAYIWAKSGDQYLHDHPTKINFNNEIPISISFHDQNKSFSIATNLRTQFVIDLPDMMQTKNMFSEGNIMVTNNIWPLKYPSNIKLYQQTMVPIIIGGNSKIFLAGSEKGYIYYWKDEYQVQNNCGGFLKGHISKISNLLFDQNQEYFYSQGLDDSTIIEWKVDYVLDSTTTSLYENGVQVNEQYLQNIMKTEIQQFSSHLWREFIITNVYQRQQEQLKDSFGLFRGTNKKILNQFLQKQVISFDNTQFLPKRAPQIQLKLQFIYGFQGFDRRNSLFFIHLYSKQNQADIKKQNTKSNKENQIKEVDQGSITYKNLIFSKKQLLNYDDLHFDCQRHFIYFIGRVVIIYNPIKHIQTFYECHKEIVTQLAIHPSKNIVASSEGCIDPKIHIWSIWTLEPYKIIQTSHSGGISILQFSRDGSFIYSLSHTTVFYIQVINWKSEAIVALRNLGFEVIFNIKVNPYNKYEFVTCGYQNVSIYEIQGGNFIRKSLINIEQEGQQGSKCIVTVVEYINYNLGNVIQSDLISGNSFGDISLLIHGQNIMIKAKAHQASINCIRISEIYNEKIIIISAGEDESIKIWDTKFNLINDLNIRKSLNLEESSRLINYSAQSLDIFTCISSQEDKNKNLNKNQQLSNQLEQKQFNQVNPIILFGTRNGDIVEAAMNLEYSGIQLLKEQPIILKNINVQQNEDESDKDDSSSQDQASQQHLTDVDSSIESDDQTQKSFTKLLNQKKNSNIANFSFSFQIYLRSHCSQICNFITAKGSIQENKDLIDSRFYQQKKIKISIHPSLPILCSIGQDNFMNLWDIELNKLFYQNNLLKALTAVKFSPDGDLICLGFEDGTIMMLDSKIQKNIGGQFGQKFIMPSFECLLQVKVKDHIPTAVLAIEFSCKGEMVAISYDSVRQRQEFQSSKFDKEQSYVSIYLNKNSPRTTMNKDNQLYAKYTDINIKQNTTTDIQEGQEIDQCQAVYFMVFSQNENYLLMYQQFIDRNHVRDNKDSSGQYIIQDIFSNKQIKLTEEIQSIQWSRFEFPNSINAKYSYIENLQISQELIDKKQQNSLKISAMVDKSPYYLIFGTDIGEIFLIKQQCLFTLQGDHLIEQYLDQEMCLGKAYSAHSCFIDQLCFCQRYQSQTLFTTGIYDECIMQWVVNEEQNKNDLDNIEYPLDNESVKDPYLETLSKEDFISFKEEILRPRKEINDVLHSVEHQFHPKCELKIRNIIGRKAFTVRNNLLYFDNDKILYSEGPNFIICEFQVLNQNIDQQQDQEQSKISNTSLQEQKKNIVIQEFLDLESQISTNKSAPEIGVFTLSNDKKILVAGTNEIDARIFQWEICSRIQLRCLILVGIIMITNIKLAHDNRHLLCLALTNQYRQALYLIDCKEKEILSCMNFIHSVAFKIKDIEFVPNSIYQFVACGPQYIAMFNYKGGLLSYYNFQIEMSSTQISLTTKMKTSESNELSSSYSQSQSQFSSDIREQDEEEEGLIINFLCVIFIFEQIITGAEDGFIYIWDLGKIIKKQNAHPDASVLCLSKEQERIITLNQKSKQFVSGATDGKVILWRFLQLEHGEKPIIEKFYEYNLDENNLNSSQMPFQLQIQSVCIGETFILVGTKSGDIYELLLPQQGEPQNQSYQTVINLRLSCQDHEIVQTADFSPNSEFFYVISKMGLFSIYELLSQKRIYCYDYNQQVKNLIICKSFAIIFIAFMKKIIAIRSQDPYEKIKELKLSFEANIADVKLSPNENILAIANDPDEQGNEMSKINLYQVKLEINQYSISFMCSISNLSTGISFLDFSTDSFYLVFQDQFEQTKLIELQNMTGKPITNLMEYSLEWCSDGNKLLEQTQGVQSFYNEENRLLKLVKVNDQIIIVTDSLGTIRIFNYPYASGSGYGYNRCYTNHLNQIHVCVVSQDRRFLLSSSLIDKSIIIWDIVPSLEEIEKQQIEEQQTSIKDQLELSQSQLSPILDSKQQQIEQNYDQQKIQ